MNNITYALSVDVNNPIIPYNVYVASVLDSNVRYLEVTLYENGNVIALSDEATATAALVTDDVLVDGSVECTISDNIITVPLEDLQQHGNLDVQVTVTEGERVLAIPFPIQVKVMPNIVEEAQVDENSLGSYAEVVHEIAEARGSYDKLKDRLDHTAAALAGKLDDAARVIGERHIVPGAVTGSKLAENAVDNTHIKNGAVTEGKLSADVRSKLNGITPGGDIDLSDYYTKDEVDGALLDKADADDVDAALRDISTLSSGKADKTSVYTKAEIDSKIGSGSIVSVISDHSQTGDDVNFPSVNAVRNYAKIYIDDLGDVIEDEINEVAGNIPTKTSQLTNDSGFLTAHQDISGKENTSNKVTSISASSTNTQYPSALAVKNYVDTALGVIESGSY